MLETLLAAHPTGTVYVAWDNAITHQDGEIEAVVRGRLGAWSCFYLPTYSPWLNPIERVWRQVRREVTHCEFSPSIQALVSATEEFFARYNQQPQVVLSIIGSHAAELL